MVSSSDRTSVQVTVSRRIGAPSSESEPKREIGFRFGYYDRKNANHPYHHEEEELVTKNSCLEAVSRVDESSNIDGMGAAVCPRCADVLGIWEGKPYVNPCGNVELWASELLITRNAPDVEIASIPTLAMQLPVKTVGKIAKMSR